MKIASDLDGTVLISPLDVMLFNLSTGARLRPGSYWIKFEDDGEIEDVHTGLSAALDGDHDASSLAWDALQFLKVNLPWWLNTGEVAA